LENARQQELNKRNRDAFIYLAQHKILDSWIQVYTIGVKNYFKMSLKDMEN
jgi:hypothetical protein